MNHTKLRTLMCLAPVVLSGCGEWPEEVVRPVGVQQQRLAAWAPTASPMSHARYDHTATVLPNGKVLVVGGLGGSTLLASAELYDPSTGAWTPAGSLQTVRYRHTATLLPNGKVLVAGGYADGWTENSVELYDPETNSWTQKASMNESRAGHTATLLPDGKVLVVSGEVNTEPVYTFELYNPVTNTWKSSEELCVVNSFPCETPYFSQPRSGHTATLLPNGKVLIIGGGGLYEDVVSVELYDPETYAWTPLTNLTDERSSHTATLLPDGKVLVAGGYDASFKILASAELYDPTGNGTTTWLEHTLSEPRRGHTASLLANGKVLVVGGRANTSVSNSADLYDPSTKTWSTTVPMTSGRVWHEASVLPTGQVLVTGGYDSSGAILSSAELYTP
ncbi:hypothetical protein F0U60_28300 [Archangium minus]|uniref:High-affinity leucine-specific transport system, periplasmic binding protein LivK n=1 Tax=Archangium minus TaxID=83450 RepID=A0ABY9WWS6_9BACT|nr:hypothetical protein F0U60_28300 [Archangium minus]